MDTQIEGMKEAINKVATVGPDFLSHKISADDMAHTMIDAVKSYNQEVENKATGQLETKEAQELQNVMQELMNCGSGFLANRCDAACVARTINYMVEEFPQKL